MNWWLHFLWLHFLLLDKWIHQKRSPLQALTTKYPYLTPALTYSALLPNAIDGIVLFLSKINPFTYLLSSIQVCHFGISLSFYIINFPCLLQYFHCHTASHRKKVIILSHFPYQMQPHFFVCICSKTHWHYWQSPLFPVPLSFYFKFAHNRPCYLNLKLLSLWWTQN